MPEVVHKRRILLVVRWPVGGIRTFLRYVYRCFDPEEWSFTILLPLVDEVDALCEDLKSQNVSVVTTSNDPSALMFSLSVFRELFFGNYDFVHSHGFTSAVCVTFPSIIFRKKNFITSHDVLNFSQFNGLKGILRKCILNISLKNSYLIHSVSYDAQQNLLTFFPRLNSEKCLVIPNGIDSNRFYEAKPSKNYKINFEREVFLIGFFGRFMNQKGFCYLVDAIEILINSTKIKRTPLVLAYGWGGFVEREIRQIKSRGLDNYFEFMPFESNIASAVKSLDVVAMPSLWEACGLLAMETLVCGVPLIASNCIGLREVVKDTPTVMVEMKSAESLADAIRKLMEKDFKNEFEKFSKIAASRFEVTNRAKELLKIYEEMY